VTPDWLRDSVARGSSLPYADYAALPDLNLKEGEDDDEKRTSSKSESRFASLHGSPRPARSQSPSRAAAVEDVTPPAFLLPPPVPPPDVELDHTTRLCCSRASPLICVNQPLCAALDVLRRSRALESNERSALSYARAISVSMTLPCFTLFRSQLVYALNRVSKVLTFASHTYHTSAYWVIVSVPAKNHGQGARGGTETAIHWREDFQDGGPRTN
jgi:hypothetical protein